MTNGDPYDAAPSGRAARLRRLGVLSMLAALAACGGGGAGAPPPPPPPPPPTVDTSHVAVSDPGSTLPAGWQHGAFMEVFVRSYQDSDGDGQGDLKGLASRLDYLHDLGIRGLWLMPVTASGDHDHGYAVADYRRVETAYGSLADLDALIAQAHARGIAIVLDYVMNHSASANPLFVDTSLSTTSPYRDWYLWQTTHPDGWQIYGRDPWHAGATGWYFGGFDGSMPDWNLVNPDVVAYHEDNLRFWLNRGVDGFRFDAVGNLFENGPGAWEVQPQDDALMAALRTQVLGAYANRWMVCEVPAAPQRFGAPDVCGSAFAFDINTRIALAAQGDTASLQAVSQYFGTAPAGMSTMVSNHDSFAGARLWDQVGGDVAAYELAAATYLLLPGTPFIYYGEEIGMATGAPVGGDTWLRTPMSWTADATTAGFTSGQPYRELSRNVATQNAAAQMADAHSILAFYRDMLALRNGRASLSQGAYVAPFVAGQAMGFQRVAGNETTLVVLNTGASATTVAVAALPAGGTLAPLYPAGGATVTASGSGTASLAVGARAVQVYAVTPP